MAEINENQTKLRVQNSWYNTTGVFTFFLGQWGSLKQASLWSSESKSVPARLLVEHLRHLRNIKDTFGKSEIRGYHKESLFWVSISMR